MESKDYTACTYCNEMVLKEAVFCPHCVHEIQPSGILTTKTLLTALIFIAVLLACFYIVLSENTFQHTAKYTKHSHVSIAE